VLWKHWRDGIREVWEILSCINYWKTAGKNGLLPELLKCCCNIVIWYDVISCTINIMSCVYWLIYTVVCTGCSYSAGPRTCANLFITS